MENFPLVPELRLASANYHADLDYLCVNALRFMSVDAVQNAGSGHPGMPLGAAAMAFALWDRFLKFNPKDPHLKKFRKWGGCTPGHPEYRKTRGVEATTGPLGQGFGNAVGMALAEQALAARFNRPGYTIVNHFTFVLASDGDMMEGISSEAASLAGHLRLGKLIVLYDENLISIEGHTNLAFTEDVLARFAAYQWHVQRVEDGNDLMSFSQALELAKHTTDKPSFIAVRTHIGFGSPHKQDTQGAHGEPLGVAEVALTKKHLGWPIEPLFYVPKEVLEHFRLALPRGEKCQQECGPKDEKRHADFKPDCCVHLLGPDSNHRRHTQGGQCVVAPGAQNEEYQRTDQGSPTWQAVKHWREWHRRRLRPRRCRASTDPPIETPL